MFCYLQHCLNITPIEKDVEMFFIGSLFYSSRIIRIMFIVDQRKTLDNDTHVLSKNNNNIHDERVDLEDWMQPSYVLLSLIHI